MPLSNYDSLFGHKKGSAAKVKRSLAKQHGQKKGDRIFSAMVRQRRAKGGLKGRMRSGRS